MDAFNIYLPIAGIEFNVLLLLVIGFCVGTLGSFFGVGGGWITTPALNIFGFPMTFAIGTDLAQIFGTSIIATKEHSLLGNVDWKLGLLPIIGALFGIEVGKRLILLLEASGDVGIVVRVVYMVFLFGLGIYMTYDYRSARKRQLREEKESTPQTLAETTSPAARHLARYSLPPCISLPVSGIERISFWVLFGIMFFTGLFSGFMGVGGGFILLPALIYLVGCPTNVAVGTSLLCVAVISGYGCFTYSLSGRTELIAAVIMLGGAAIGTKMGVWVTRHVQGYGIRIMFAVMLLLAGTSVALKQAEALFEIEVLGTLAAYSVMGSAVAVTLFLIIRLIYSLKKSRSTNTP